MILVKDDYALSAEETPEHLFFPRDESIVAHSLPLPSAEMVTRKKF
jgi:hypothetical protein